MGALTPIQFVEKVENIRMPVTTATRIGIWGFTEVLANVLTV
jgi:hypothetical protein